MIYPGKQCRPSKRIIASQANSGFTLIELLVVMALVSMMLLFSTPRMRRALIMNEADHTARRIINTVRTLREQSVMEQQVYLLNIDLDGQRLWPEAVPVPEGDETGDPENPAEDKQPLAEPVPQMAEAKVYSLPDDVRITDVATPGQERWVSGTIRIGFYPQGYSGMALIHLEDNDGGVLSLVVEPLLNRVQVYREYIEWEAAN